MTHQLGAMPAVRTLAAIAGDRLPFAVRLNRHDDPATDAPAPEVPAAKPDPAKPDTPTTDADDDPKLGPAGEKALAAMKERAKAAEAAQRAAEAKVQEYEDRDKSDLEKATAAAERATAEAAAAKAELLRQRVINETGLPAELAEFLPTGDEDSVRGAADKLKAALGTGMGQAKPKPDPSQGSGRTNATPDYANMPQAEFRAAVKALGIRSYR